MQLNALKVLCFLQLLNTICVLNLLCRFRMRSERRPDRQDRPKVCCVARDGTPSSGASESHSCEC